MNGRYDMSDLTTAIIDVRCFIREQYGKEMEVRFDNAEFTVTSTGRLLLEQDYLTRTEEHRKNPPEIPINGFVEHFFTREI